MTLGPHSLRRYPLPSCRPACPNVNDWTFLARLSETRSKAAHACEGMLHRDRKCVSLPNRMLHRSCDHNQFTERPTFEMFQRPQGTFFTSHNSFFIPRGTNSVIFTEETTFKFKIYHCPYPVNKQFFQSKTAVNENISELYEIKMLCEGIWQVNH